MCANTRLTRPNAVLARKCFPMRRGVNHLPLDSKTLKALHRFAAGSDDIIFVVNGAFCIEYLNSCALRTMGGNMREIKGMSFEDFLPAGNHEFLAKNFTDVFKSGKPVSFENNLVLPDRKITLDVRLCPVRSGSRSVQGVLGIARDITERKDLENLIARSRREWIRAVDGMSHSLAVVGPGYRIERINQAMALRLKSTVHDAIGLICYEQFHGTQGPPRFCPLLNGMGDGEYTSEVMEQHLGDACMSNISSIRDGHGKTVGCVYIAREISEVERFMKSRKSGEAYMRMLLKSCEYSVYVQNTDGKYVYFNTMPGDLVPAGLIGNSPFEFFDPEIALKIVGRVKEVAVHGKELAHEIDYASGEEVLGFFDRVSPVKDAMGRVKAVLTVSVKAAEFRRIEVQGQVPRTASKNLSEREREVLSLISRGLTSTQIAAGLSISKKTVETHRARIMKKLDLHKISALVRYAAKAGLLD
jgi:PAS domain S-box-containing protein